MEISKIQFKNAYHTNRLNFEVNDTLISSSVIRMMDLNEEQIIVIIRGIRYDISRSDIRITYK